MSSSRTGPANQPIFDPDGSGPDRPSVFPGQLSMPPGGLPGQVLMKASDNDHDLVWAWLCDCTPPQFDRIGISDSVATTIETEVTAAAYGDTLLAAPSGQLRIIPGTTLVARCDRTTSPVGVFGIYDFSDPYNLSFVFEGVPGGGTGSYYVSGYGFDLDPAGITAYIGNSAQDRIIPVDISNPAAPVEGTSVATSSHLNSVRCLGVAGGKLVTGALLSDDVASWDISSRLVPSYIGEIVASSSGPLLGVVYGDYFYVVHNTTGVLRAYNCVPSVPTLPGSTLTLGDSRTDISRSNVPGFLTVTAGFYETVQIIDVTDPANPTLHATVTLASGQVNSAYLISPTRLATADGPVMWLWDITNPASPVQLSSVDIEAESGGIVNGSNFMDYDPTTKTLLIGTRLNAGDRLTSIPLS